MTGKEKCKLLRQIRQEIAQRNGIKYTSKECTYEGEDCLGTCPVCDSELVYLESQLNEKMDSGEPVRLMTEEYPQWLNMDNEAVENISLQSVLSGDWMEMPIEELGLHQPIPAYLERIGIKVVGDLVCRTEKEMLNWKRVPAWVLSKIKSTLAQMGLSFRADPETSKDEDWEIDW